MPDQDRMDLLVRVIRAEEAKRELDEIRGIAARMTEEQKRAIAEVATTQRSARMVYTEMNQALEIVNRAWSIAQRAVHLYVQAIQMVGERSRETRIALTELASAQETLSGAFAHGSDAAGGASQALRETARAARDLKTEADFVGRAWSGFTEGLVAGALDAYLAVSSLALSIADLWRGMAPGESLVAGIEEWFRRMQERMTAAGRSRYGDQARILGDVEPGEEAPPRRTMGIPSSMVLGRDPGGRARTREPGRGGGGGGGEAEPPPGQKEFLVAAAEATRLAEEEAEKIAGLADAFRTLDEAIAEQTERQIAAQEKINEELEREIQLREQRHETATRQKAADIALDQKRAAAVQDAVGQFEQYAQAATTLGGAFADVFGQLAASEEEGSKEAERYGKIQGGILAAIAFVNSAVEYAKAIASGANQDYGAMAAHIAAGVAYDVAGAMALAQLGGSARSAGGGGASGSHVPLREEVEAERGGEGATIVIQTMGLDSARVAQVYRGAERRAKRSGVDMPMIGSGGYE